jgi:CBS domain containing-hemolysin-like protein
MERSEIVLSALLPALLVVSGMASASETALFGVTPGEEARLRRAAPLAARAVESLRSRPRQLLGQVLLMNMLANTAYFIVTSVLTVRAGSPTLKVAVSAGSVLAIVLFGEVFAKLLASSARVGFLRVAAPVHLGIRGVLGGFLAAFDRFVIAPLSRLAVPNASEPAPVTPEELGELIALSTREGALRGGEQELLRSIVAFGGMRVREVMRPRVDIVWAERDAPRDALIEVCARSGHTRIPLCVGGPDGNVVGMLDATRYMAGEPVQRASDPVRFVPELARLDTLLERFRTEGTSAAVCVDEHGGVSGLITVADVVGVLVDSSSGPQGPDDADVERTGERSWLVPGRLPVRDMATAFGVKDAVERAGRATTIGGLVVSLLGRFPAEGDAADLGDLRLRVAEVRDRTVLRVEVVLRERAGAARQVGVRGERAGGRVDTIREERP